MPSNPDELYGDKFGAPDDETSPPTKLHGATQFLYRRLFEATETAGHSSTEMPRGSETILLVEDTSWLRELIRRGLETCGYTVLEAADGEAAIRLAGAHPGPIHLLVSDLGLPGIGGRSLVEQLGALKPGLKLLFISGYSAEALQRHGAMASETAFLQKPFAPRTMAFKVREVLNR